MKKSNAGYAGFARGILLSGSAAMAMVAPSVAFAQDAAEPAEQVNDDDVYPQDEDFATGNEIIVTATKRAQTLQDTPVAVSVTSAETLERGQIRDLRDLQTVVPSLTVGQRQSLGATNFFIRGFGNGANNAGIEPSVGVFVDGVYRSRSVSQVTDLPNVQRIEVLRGPQSTLFGKNASAGVISISTQAPAFDLGGSLEATYGNFDQIIVKGYLTGPLSENTAASIAGGYNKRDGFFRDLGTGGRTNDRDRWFLRGQMLFDAGGDLSLRLIGDVDGLDEVCCGVVNVQDGIASPVIRALGGELGDPSNPFSGVVYNNFDSSNQINNVGVSGEFKWDIGGSGTEFTSITAYRRSTAISNQDADFTSVDLISPLFQDLTIGTFTQEFRITTTLFDRVDLLGGLFFISENINQDAGITFGTQFRPYADILISQLSGGALDIQTLELALGAGDGNPFQYLGEFFAQGQGLDEEYALDSRAFSAFGQIDIELADGLTLTLGGNYTNDKKDFRTNTVSTDVFSGIDLNAPQYAGFRGQLLAGGFLATAIGQNVLMLGRDATQAEIMAFAMSSPQNAAIFASLQAQAGAFAAANANNPAANPLNPLAALQFLPPFLNIPNAVEDGRTRDSEFTYTIRLNYDMGDFNFYATYATGFKASSVNLSRDSRPFPSDRNAIIANGLNLNNLTFISRFAEPEKSRVIEAGVKANLGDISANLTVFDQEIEGFQSNLFTGTGFALLNAGKQSTFGVEFDGVANFGDLTLTGAVTYLDPVYDDFRASALGDLSGQRPAGIPEFTVVVSAQYEARLGNGSLIPRVSYFWQSEVQLVEGLPNFLVRDNAGNIINAQPALDAAKPFTREVNDVTASLSYEFDSGLSLSVWGRNLLDTEELGTIFDSVAQPRGISGYPNDPRTYGVTARYRF
ncbi:TonB-dependent receptor [Paraurantiacibacter namhicola]|uniref:Pesticin receptor n=1 Tax=Paraurantiacibacter namhicola TaxID=645517 RepID=A0A1C7DB12_9SPHN|nr:TonB-dependent receptor [Paraurantiacibacter namhicola]ANU08511.1 Pesticin receptor precursor [Paraurantiacibacter namhicola]